MALFPEKEKPQAPEVVQEAPEVPEIPRHIESAGVTVRPTQPQPISPSDQPPTATSFSAPTLNIPTDTTTLTVWSKGGITESLTWLGLFWLRMMKKAVHFGWRVVSGNNNVTS